MMTKDETDDTATILREIRDELRALRREVQGLKRPSLGLRIEDVQRVLGDPGRVVEVPCRYETKTAAPPPTATLPIGATT